MVTKEEGKKIWAALVEKHFGYSKSLKVDLSFIGKKLLKVRFTRNGAMVTMRNGRVDKAYCFAKNRHGALVKIYEETIDEIEAKNHE